MITKQQVLEIIDNWQIKKQPEYRGFYCGRCLDTLTKAWHVWVLTKRVKVEVHLCTSCYKEVNKNGK